MASDVRPRHPLLLSIWICLLASLARAFYVPGYSIKSYKQDENIPLLVNKIYSDNTQLQYAYFDLPFVCPPTGSKHHDSSWASGQSLSLNLGEVLRGDRIKNSDFEINMGQDVECAYLCDRIVNGHDVEWAQQLIEDGYVTEWILDNLPGATSFVTVDRERKYYAAGFKLGYKDYDTTTGKPTYYLNNHYTMVVRWRKAPGSAGDNGGRVVTGFEVYTKSVDRGQRNETGCPSDLDERPNPLPLYIAPNTTDLSEQYPDSSYIPQAKIDLDQVFMNIPYTYSVYFREEKEIEWANRWDLYFNDQAESNTTHWLAIVNSIIISSILGVVCMIIWVRTTSRDTKGRGDGLLEEATLRPKRRSEKKTNGLLEKEGQDLMVDDLSDDEALEDVSGWKMLHADVFRPPALAGLLAPLVGSGFQLVCMIGGLLSLSCLGVLNPSWRGGFITVGVFIFFFAGGVSGYLSARLYKTFGGQNYRKNTLLTALLFPGLLFSLVFFLNLFTWAQASSTAIPFTTLLVLAFLWLLIQLPLVHLGSHYGFYRSKGYSHPTRTSTTPRHIPFDNTTWYSRNRLLLSVLAGLVPFAVLFIELIFVFKSVYLDKSSYYYVFGFLSIITLLLAITIGETVIICLYVQLCAENYHWGWTSFLTGGSSAVWIFVYLNWYYWTKLHIDGFVSSLLFFSYGVLACLVYGLATGTIGFLVGYTFVRRIYGGVKVD
ncbi:hypothetical protein OHC33_010540 [Knufia fluminis]|uniref:Transmembrane 9 superfamily member n=1 Tax=Knufia fluminis TaxID=191047 RepID=A0AAN8I3G7_9EURO|nr:hypothetical protein OHC33_010540 [Knufia fluminis]